MSMVHDGEVCYESSVEIKRMLDDVVRTYGARVPRIGRFAQVLDETYVSTKTPKPKPPPKDKPKAPPRMGGEVKEADDTPMAESEQAGTQARKPPHLVVCRWIKPPPAVQAHLQGAKLGKGQALFLEVRTDLWSLMSERAKRAALFSKIMEKEIVDQEDGSFKIRKADMPIQTHPAVEREFGRWWEEMDPDSADDV